MRRHQRLVVGAMVAVFIALAFAFELSAGVFGLIGLAGWLLEKPLQRLADRLAAVAACLEAEADVENSHLKRDRAAAPPPK